MPKGNWFAIFAAIAWLILSGAQLSTEHTGGNKSVQKAASAAKTSAAPTPIHSADTAKKFKAYPGYNPDPCYRAEDHDAADLCAQWRAALGAEKAAHESRRATNWAIIATILSALGFAGLAYTIIQTQGSLQEARRGNLLAMRENARATRRALASARETNQALEAAKASAEAANRHADTVEKTAKFRMRGYVIVNSLRTHSTADGRIWIIVDIKNAGITPVRIKRTFATIWIAEGGIIDPMGKGRLPIEHYHIRDWFPQGSVDRILAYTEEGESIDKLNSTDKYDAYIYGRVEYADIFGDDHWMTFAYRPDTWGVGEDTTFQACIHGNDGD